MVQKEFTDEEIAIIRETLKDYISGLEAEIRGADNLSFGTAQKLFHKKTVVEGLMERMVRTAV
jgi:hypothetical protein